MKMLSWRVAVFLLPVWLCAQSLQEFEKRVTEFTLDNGLHFIVLQRREAPVVSFYAYVDTGSVNDPRGKTGLAHMFEHMIGKGTARVGATNWPEERKALQQVEAIYDELEQERRKRGRADPEVVKKLEADLQKAIEKANSYVNPNEFVRVVEESGGVGFNAGTGPDRTTYFYSLPSNRIELWFLLQSEWFRQPVYREFYKERDVVREERRMRVESSPQGKLQELLMATAFIASPYRTLIGWASDIENLRAEDADRFHRAYYVPANITIAIAGDVDPAHVRRLADKYYARIPAGPLPPLVITEEPPQEGERRVTVESVSQPILMMAYKRPDQRHDDDPVLDVVASILSSGRTGMMYREMVRDKQIALAAAAIAAFPSAKYPSLFLLYSVPNMGHSVEDNEKATEALLEQLKREKVDEETLQRVKTKIRAGLIRQLANNSGLASQLAFYHVNYGDWRTLFTGIEVIDKVTADDVQRVARKYFDQKTRTVAYLVKPGAAEAPANNAGGEAK
ncbi:MAG: insulinase family protein [Bryobacteraceae bacterium]|nr:insulinase family protein [Bryobacteraceae bacterium]